MALITPEQLIVYLDLPDGTQQADRAQLACDLAIDAVTRRAPGQVLTDPPPAGVKGIAFAAASRLYDNPTMLRSATIDDFAQTYSGDVIAVLTKAERDELDSIFGAGGTRPQYSFPEWDWSWTASTTSTLSD